MASTVDDMSGNFSLLMDPQEPPCSTQEAIQPPWRPRHLRGTTSSNAVDSSQQAEFERLSNTFCSGSHWTLGKLPTHFEPGSIQTARKMNTMTNLLGKNCINFITDCSVIFNNVASHRQQFYLMHLFTPYHSTVIMCVLTGRM